MNRGLTDRERCHMLEARVAELEAELAAWRGNQRDDLRSADEEQRLLRLRMRLQRGDRRAALTAAAMLARMIDHPGVAVSKAQLIAASRHAGTGDAEPELKVACVQINFLRKALAVLGLHHAIETVWGVGYLVAPREAAAVKALLEPTP